MSKDPAFLFYSSDFLSSTILMTNEQIGCYVRLLCIQHQKGKLTEREILQICGSRDEDIFAKFVLQPDGTYINTRLEIESKRRKDYAESRRKNISKRYEKNMKNTSTTYVEHMETETETETETENKTENKDKNGVETKFDAKDALLKMGVDSNLADEWLKVRKNKHLTNTRTAFLKIWREIKKTDLTANDCIKAAIEHSWGGFEAEWLTNSTFAKKAHKNDESSLTNPEVYKNIKFT
jgi:hypothetical protein